MSPPWRAIAAVVVTVCALVLILSFQTPEMAVNQLRGRLSSPLPTATASATATPTAGTTPTPTAASGYRDGTYTGQDFPNFYGDVQLQVVIHGGRITDVVALALPNDNPRSAYISQVAGPMLHDQVIQAQSANIDGVSGATYTSQSYAESVQSALDQAH